MPRKTKSGSNPTSRRNAIVADLMTNPAFAAGTSDEPWMRRAELLLDKRSGRIRQAGAASAEGQFILLFKQTCEESLYAFCDGVLNYWFLEASLHKPVCEWLTKIPPYRKMLLMPRNHGKSTIVGRGVPLHVLIQPKDTNRYFPGEPGTHLRLVLAGETEQRAQDHMRVLIGALENNVLLRALWPHVCWDNPRRQSKKWNEGEIICPRDTEFPEPTIRAIGVGGAITGAHPNMLIKDDLTTERAANEPPTMAKAIEWHLDSRALFEDPEKNIEIITGTRWAAFDLPGYIAENDSTVEVNTEWRQVVQDGKVIFPSKYGFKGAVAQLQAEHGVKFPLLFMNTVAGSSLTDFLVSDLRDYELHGDKIVFTENENDVALTTAVNEPKPRQDADVRGMNLYTALSVGNLDYLRNTRSL